MFCISLLLWVFPRHRCGCGCCPHFTAGYEPARDLTSHPLSSPENKLVLVSFVNEVTNTFASGEVVLSRTGWRPGVSSQMKYRIAFASREGLGLSTGLAWGLPEPPWRPGEVAPRIGFEPTKEPTHVASDRSLVPENKAKLVRKRLRPLDHTDWAVSVQPAVGFEPTFLS